MKRDELEERILRIEQRLRDMEQVQREQGDTILAELNSFQQFFLEERIEAMQQQVMQGHQRLLLDLFLGTVRREFDTICPDPCSLMDRGECIDFFICRLRESGERAEPDDAASFRETQTRMDDELAIRYPELLSESCRACYTVYTMERDHLMDAIGRLSTFRSALRRQGRIPLTRDLPEDEAFASLIEPLSHPARFRMIKALAGGSMSYKELSTLSGFRGGHLLFHVTRLIEADLVAKNGNSGQYSLTVKGIGLMDLVRKLYSGMQPSSPRGQLVGNSPG